MSRNFWNFSHVSFLLKKASVPNFKLLAWLNFWSFLTNIQTLAIKGVQKLICSKFVSKSKLLKLWANRDEPRSLFFFTLSFFRQRSRLLWTGENLNYSYMYSFAKISALLLSRLPGLYMCVCTRLVLLNVGRHRFNLTEDVGFDSLLFSAVE